MPAIRNGARISEIIVSNNKMYYFLPRALPEGLEALTELALDLRWTWSHAGDALWRKLDPDLWERTRSPWAILRNISQQSLEALVRDPVFVGRHVSE